MKKYRIEPDRPDPVFFSFREFISVIEKNRKKVVIKKYREKGYGREG